MEKKRQKQDSLPLKEEDSPGRRSSAAPWAKVQLGFEQWPFFSYRIQSFVLYKDGPDIIKNKIQTERTELKIQETSTNSITVSRSYNKININRSNSPQRNVIGIHIKRRNVIRESLRGIENLPKAILRTEKTSRTKGEDSAKLKVFRDGICVYILLEQLQITILPF